ncbi:class II aldolase/adducin family protein [Tepidanaerobacter syntrophicus]|uniref:class II aldolase/adducin family protein n=1 Tax=Tepidanaerobacter syntrophicus TaxID=224999 RepID=UPI001BD23E44|nr:class II aldolase/adducin family protein [Tepidanaerobacter syntrophicus]
MLEQLKKEVLETARLAERSGLCHHGGGNFSMTDRKEGLIAITPSGKNRFDIDFQDIIIVDFSGNIVENVSNYKPSSELPMHLEILKARLDINAICHTHARHAAVFSVLNKEVKPVICESLTYGGYCRVAPFEIPGTIELGRAAVKAMEGTKAVILEHHGLVCVGNNIYEAYKNSIYVEDVAEVCLKAMNIVDYSAVSALSDEQIKDMIARGIGA